MRRGAGVRRPFFFYWPFTTQARTTGALMLGQSDADGEELEALRSALKIVPRPSRHRVFRAQDGVHAIEDGDPDADLRTEREMEGGALDLRNDAQLVRLARVEEPSADPGVRAVADDPAEV